MFYRTVLIASIFFTACEARADMENIFSLVNSLVKNPFLTGSDIKSVFSCELKSVENNNILNDLLGEDDQSNDYQEYITTDCSKYPQIKELKATVSKDYIDYLSIILHSEKEIIFDEIIAKYGKDYEPRINRPELPVGERCEAIYHLNYYDLVFGYSDCSNLDKIIKVTVISNKK